MSTYPQTTVKPLSNHCQITIVVQKNVLNKIQQLNISNNPPSHSGKRSFIKPTNIVVSSCEFAVPFIVMVKKHWWKIVKKCKTNNLKN